MAADDLDAPVPEDDGRDPQEDVRGLDDEPVLEDDGSVPEDDGRDPEGDGRGSRRRWRGLKKDGQVPDEEGQALEPAASEGRVLALLDRAIAIQAPAVRKNIARARQRNPEATPAQVIRSLERMYVSTLTGTGAAVGGT
ncbi:hypothetical protein ACFQ07_16770, partial [Actinomadura adrarensis]